MMDTPEDRARKSALVAVELRQGRRAQELDKREADLLARETALVAAQADLESQQHRWGEILPNLRQENQDLIAARIALSEYGQELYALDQHICKKRDDAIALVRNPRECVKCRKETDAKISDWIDAVMDIGYPKSGGTGPVATGVFQRSSR